MFQILLSRTIGHPQNGVKQKCNKRYAMYWFMELDNLSALVRTAGRTSGPAVSKRTIYDPLLRFLRHLFETDQPEAFVPFRHYGQRSSHCEWC